ncbi:unnamed protein product [Taenia asiatica]|uniref:CTNNB1_binding domain-containing protein n=1 Tax=Taenia asiatica TaxID=60517 RepID=A0A0R3W056_TAEAS|nr:unnamed protein product [Taenia asiatica]
MHNLPGDSSSTPYSIPSTMISPSTNAGEATLPVLAGEDEESNLDAKGHPGASLADSDEQNQTDDQDDNFSPPENGQLAPKLQKSFTTKK